MKLLSTPMSTQLAQFDASYRAAREHLMFNGPLAGKLHTLREHKKSLGRLRTLLEKEAIESDQ